MLANHTYGCKQQPLQSTMKSACPKKTPKGTYAPQKHHTQAQHSAHKTSANTNDPSAGSPTETLLRLLLPLSDKVH